MFVPSLLEAIKQSLMGLVLGTLLWWYLVPTMRRGSGNVRRSMKKKDYGRRLSDKRLGTSFGVAPSSQAKNVGGAQEMSSPRAYRNGKRG